MFFDEINVYEKTFKLLGKLEKTITNYIFYYNHNHPSNGWFGRGL
ncbi:IS3 family transposase [Streptococcus mutans]